MFDGLLGGNINDRVPRWCALFLMLNRILDPTAVQRNQQCSGPYISTVPARIFYLESY